MALYNTLPAIGAPIAAAIPWNRHRIPNALVSFSRPIRSTTRIERSAEKHAAKNVNKNKIKSNI